MESAESTSLDDHNLSSLSTSHACATKNIQSCKTQGSESASVDARSRSQAGLSDFPENKEFHKETIHKDPSKDNSTCVATELSSFTINSVPDEKHTKMKVIPADDLKDHLDKESDETIPGMSRLSVSITSLSPPTDSVNEIRHDENALSESDNKLEMNNKCSDKVTKPMAIDMTRNLKPTQDTVSSTSSITSNVEPAEQSGSGSPERQSKDRNVCLDDKEKRITVTESTKLLDDSPKSSCSYAGSNEACASGSNIAPLPIDMGVRLENRGARVKVVPFVHSISTALNKSLIEYRYRSPNGLLQKLSLPKCNDISEYGWKPKAVITPQAPRLSYNECRRRKYKKTALDSEKLDTLVTFYDKKLQTDDESEISSIDFVDDILEQILDHTNMATSYKYSRVADVEGSVTVDASVGKLDEMDYSVDILLEDNDEMLLSGEPFNIVYADDDIDANVTDEIPTTMFVNNGKRLFPEEPRNFEIEIEPVDVPDDQVAVWLGDTDAFRFLECCIYKQTSGVEVWGWILPYPLLHHFHNVIGATIQDLDLEGVTLNNGAKGPAVTLTILQQDGPNISVDITPKLNVAADKLNVMDFHWPRKDTRKWLTKSKIDEVCAQPIYLVPKGDKYWKISFANLENELLDDIDDNGTWRKQCLRIMKKKLVQWKSKSRSGLKCISSYLLKTTLLWLCEILPKDSFWTKDQLANRYLNFLKELERRLKKKNMGEYFYPSLNLLEYKDEEDIEELRQFLVNEIKEFTE